VRIEGVMPIRLLLASREPILLYGLEKLFEPQADVRVTAACRALSEVLSLVESEPPDVVLVDVSPDEEQDLSLLRALAALSRPPPAVILVSALGPATLLTVLELGVRGVLLKEMDPRLFVECVRKVHRGERWVERHSEAQALEWMVRREATLREISRELTHRELEIVELLVTGLSNKEIGARLGISHTTVKVHLRNVFRKLGIDSRVALLRWARERGLT
jgi:DNA-binding NarL/FixJ family response regulator